MIGKVEESPLLYKFSSPEAYLPLHGHVTALAVAPQHRRCGLAQALTRALEQGCEEQGALFVDLFVRESNSTAVQLYEGMGYSVYRRVVDYYSDNPTGGDDGADGEGDEEGGGGDGGGEDAFDMRKALKRDKGGKYIRKDGRNYRVEPVDIYHP